MSVLTRAQAALGELFSTECSQSVLELTTWLLVPLLPPSGPEVHVRLQQQLQQLPLVQLQQWYGLGHKYHNSGEREAKRKGRKMSATCQQHMWP